MIIYKDDGKVYPEEIVYGVQVYQHRGQQRRNLISFDPARGKFSVNSWSSWRRIPAECCEEFDPDGESNMRVADASDIAAMESSWPKSALKSIKSLDALQKQTYLGPVALQDARE